MIRVVLADDHPLFLEGLRFTLERAGDIVVVAEACDGVDAVEHARRLLPDVVVMDLVMPRLGGLAATERLAGGPSRVLVLTMSEEDGNVFAALRAGAAGYLVKGAAAGEVLAAVRAVAAGHAVLGPGLAARALDFFSPRASAPSFPELSPREREILQHVASGLSNQEIADRLVISPVTVRNHVSSILSKLHLSNRREAMLRYHERQPSPRPESH